MDQAGLSSRYRDCIACLNRRDRDALGGFVADPPHIASRLWFDCTPTASFLGLDVGGRRVSFAEHAFYCLGMGRIEAIWSVLDRAAIEEQLRRS